MNSPLIFIRTIALLEPLRALYEEGAGSKFSLGLPWWQLLLILIVVVIVVWWALSWNSNQTALDQPEKHPGSHEETHEDQTPVAERGGTIDEVLVDDEPPASETPVVEKTLPPEVPDDLKKIEGIGPKISGVFQTAGITTFDKMAATEAVELQRILDEAQIRLGDPATWPAQAKLAAAGDWKGLEELQDKLKGGRLVE